MDELTILADHPGKLQWCLERFDGIDVKEEKCDDDEDDDEDDDDEDEDDDDDDDDNDNTFITNQPSISPIPVSTPPPTVINPTTLSEPPIFRSSVILCAEGRRAYGRYASDPNAILIDTDPSSKPFWNGRFIQHESTYKTVEVLKSMGLGMGLSMGLDGMIEDEDLVDEFGDMLPP